MIPSGFLYSRMVIHWSNRIGLSEWNCWSSGLHSEEIPVSGNCCALNVADLWVVSLGRASRSGPLPYPRYMSSSLALEWIEVQGKKEVGGSSDSIFMLQRHLAWEGGPFFKLQSYFQSP